MALIRGLSLELMLLFLKPWDNPVIETQGDARRSQSVAGCFARRLRLVLYLRANLPFCACVAV